MRATKQNLELLREYLENPADYQIKCDETKRTMKALNEEVTELEEIQEMITEKISEIRLTIGLSPKSKPDLEKEIKDLQSQYAANKKILIDSKARIAGMMRGWEVLQQVEPVIEKRKTLQAAKEKLNEIEILFEGLPDAIREVNDRLLKIVELSYSFQDARLAISGGNKYHFNYLQILNVHGFSFPCKIPGIMNEFLEPIESYVPALKSKLERLQAEHDKIFTLCED